MKSNRNLMVVHVNFIHTPEKCKEIKYSFQKEYTNYCVVVVNDLRIDNVEIEVTYIN